MDKVSVTLVLQICCSFMLGTFYVAGSIDAVSAFAQGLNGHVLKIGGAAAMLLLGMLTGSQTTTQTIVFTMIGPALIATGDLPGQCRHRRRTLGHGWTGDAPPPT